MRYVKRVMIIVSTMGNKASTRALHQVTGDTNKLLRFVNRFTFRGEI